MLVAGLDGVVARAVRREESILDLAATAKAVVKTVFVGHGIPLRDSTAQSTSPRKPRSAS
jgi:hypothetical protein